MRNGKVLTSREQMYSTLVMYDTIGVHPKIHVSEAPCAGSTSETLE